jgi:hypothetical protein
LSNKDLIYTYQREACDGAFGWVTASEIGRSWFQLPMLPLQYYIQLIFRSQFASAINPAKTEKRARVIAWEWRRPVRWADNRTTFISQMSRNSGSISLLDPTGSVHARNGIANVIPHPEKF